jgi:FlaA1/EpsC-like NDP-sugar epimerase
MQPHNMRRVNSLLALPRSAKKALAILLDSALCVITVWLAICFRFESWVSLSGYQWLAVVISVGLAIPLLTAFGFYHTVIRFVGRQTISAALGAIGIYAIIYSAIFTAYGFPLVPRTIGLLQPVLLLASLGLTRLLASQLLSEQAALLSTDSAQPHVLIYGAGKSGQQLAVSLTSSGQSRVLGFLDDNVNLHQARIAGIPVYSPSQTHQLIATHGISSVLLAIPSLSRSRRNDIIRLLSQHRVAVRTLPSLNDLASGKVSEDELREVDIEDLLGREPVAPIPELLRHNITGKTVLVTGAGGSIGSELCRQIAMLSPVQLILVDASEFALYTIYEEIRPRSVEHQFELTPVLANILETDHVNQLFASLKPHTVYHAAAYKHVPLVEANPVAGLKNNVLGTYAVAHAALKAQVQDMVMISTDKAVRPTNIMGASKRLAEMVLQSLAQQHTDASQSTRFCIVRFGNVLGSSGSVVPKFREQIQRGGPVTVTHADVTRFFMTIPEAAQLVLQAGAMQQSHRSGARVYLLDMGESVKIIDLAKLMIQLSGLTVRDTEKPVGDIEIRTIGLRPGEKLYEELLISENSQPTRHSKIRSAQEKFVPLDQILTLIDNITKDSARESHTPQQRLIQIRQQIKPLVELHDSMVQRP